MGIIETMSKLFMVLPLSKLRGLGRDWD